MRRSKGLRRDTPKAREFQQRGRGGLRSGVTDPKRAVSRSKPLNARARTTVTDEHRALLLARSGGRCEAVWQRQGRCRRRGSTPQHRITRARGGHLLDAFVSTVGVWHMAALCPECHDQADNGPCPSRGVAVIDGRPEPLLVQGTLRTRPDGTVRYIGPDPGFNGLLP